MLTLFYNTVQILKPILVPLCFVVAWTFFLLLGWSLFSSIRDVLQRSKVMHDIPCTNCQFFTNDYRLKCTVRPHIANTENAIGCLDYRGKENPFSLY
ncbi:hypothetical protein [Oscillatoria sp. FACHB-1406]|uniref:hypothetical protein n=1 Tax=Oscillatoria sp. FACHB-1406 TaxID=2692846 RepID=UPI00168A2DB6|nr:hypothetical protein [Oscillatoria sp. FACHB-1406]MBD2577422.1 hypothetical protein [Oscillatoria sp. FACHB-1406]